MCYLRIANLLIITTLTTPLLATNPDALVAYSHLKSSISSESSPTHDTLQLYTYYQAKLLNDLTSRIEEKPEPPLWGLLEKGHNAEDIGQSILEWHASVLRAQNWGNLANSKWINATSEPDMILGFLTSAYTSVCLAGTGTLSDTDLTLDQIQKQSIYFLKNSASAFAGDNVSSYMIQLAIQLGRNTYYKNLYREDEALTLGASSSSTEETPPQPATDLLSAHIADLEYDENSDTDFTEILENSYTVISSDTSTLQASSDTIISQTATEIPNTTAGTPNDISIRTEKPIQKSIQEIEKILFNHSLSSNQAELPLSDIYKPYIYLTILASMAILDADGQEHDWIAGIKSYFSENSVWSKPENSETIDLLLYTAKNDAADYLYKTPSYFSYGYKKLPDPLNPSMEAQNGKLLLDSIPTPEIVGRATPVDAGFMYTKLKEMGDYGPQYLKPMDDSIISRMINQIHNDLGITSHHQKRMMLTVVQQIQEGITLTQQIECSDVITYMINNLRGTTAPYPIPFALTPEYCQWKDVVYFLDEVTRVVSAPNLIHQRTNFAHSFDLSNKDFNFANDAFMRESGIQLTQEEADAVMRGIWYKEVLNFAASYHYARSHGMLLNFYEEVLPSSKASNPCLPGKIRQVTNWHDIQLTKQQDHLLSAIRMLFPASHTYEGIQFNTFLDFTTPKLTRDFITQKIEHYAMKNSIFVDGESFGIGDFQKDDNGNYAFKKTRYQTVLEHADFETEITTEAFEAYARALLFNSLASYFIELDSMSASGTYRNPTAQQLLASGTGIQAFHSGHIVFNEDNLLELPTAILNGFKKVNGTAYEYGLLKMYEHHLPQTIDAIKRNPYGQT